MGANATRSLFAVPGDVALTPAQHACAWFFGQLTLLFLLQTLLGGATEHYRAELSNFFGIDLAQVIPFNIARTWHLQLAIFWGRHWLSSGWDLSASYDRRSRTARSTLACLCSAGRAGCCGFRQPDYCCGSRRVSRSLPMLILCC